MGLPYSNILKKLDILVQENCSYGSYNYQPGLLFLNIPFKDNKFITLTTDFHMYEYFHELAHGIDAYLRGHDSIVTDTTHMHLLPNYSEGMYCYLRSEPEIIANQVAKRLCRQHKIKITNRHKYMNKVKVPKATKKKIKAVLDFVESCKNE